MALLPFPVIEIVHVRQARECARPSETLICLLVQRDHTRQFFILAAVKPIPQAGTRPENSKKLRDHCRGTGRSEPPNACLGVG